MDEALVDLLTTLVDVRNTCTFGCILHSFLPVSTLNSLVGFISAHMSSSRRVIVAGQQDSWNYFWSLQHHHDIRCRLSRGTVSQVV